MNRPRLTALMLACCLVSPVTLTAFVRAQTSPTTPHPTSSDQLRRQVEDLRSEVSDLRKEMDQLTSRIELDEYFLKNKQTKSETISLDLTSSNYQRLDTDNGFFLVSVEQALP
jgi:hypothetical protein